MTHCELVVVGAGPGGYVAAIKAAQLGAKVTLVERGEVGGTCLNRGCIPTKTLLHTAELYGELAHAEELGLRIEGAAVDYEALRARARGVIEELRGGIEGLLAANGVALIRGEGRLDGAGRVLVSLPEGGTESLEADKIIVAAGSRPSLPPIPGIDLEGVLTSDSLLAEVPRLERLVVIGGGVIGMEFASLYTQLGTQVTVLEAAGRIVPTLDRELGQSLSMTMKKRGCQISVSATVEAIEHAPGGGLRVRYALKGAEQQCEADAVLVSTGRASNVAGLFAEGCSPELDRGRIVVDGRMATSIPGLFAIGDAAATPFQLAHAASAQGVVAACAAVGAPCDIDLSTIPACVYTSPEIACVGMDEAQAKEAGLRVRAGKFSLAGNGKSIITQQDRSFVKILVDEQGRIVGAQLMCGRATDIIGELACAVACGLSVEQLSCVVRPHPTFEEAVGEALESLLGGAVHAMPKKR